MCRRIIPRRKFGETAVHMLKWLSRPACVAIFACLLWSSAFATVKLGLRDYHKPFTLAGVRFIISGLLLLPFWPDFRRSCRELATGWKTVALTSFFSTFLLYALFFQGLNMASGAIGAVITGASPLVTAVLSHFLMGNERLTWPKVAVILLGVAGVAMLALGNDFRLTGDHTVLLGMLLLFMATISSGLSNIIVSFSRRSTGMSPLVLNSVQIFMGGVALLALGLVWEGAPELMGRPWRFYVALGWLSVLSAVAFSLWFALLKRPETKVSDLNQWKFIIPGAGATLSWLLVPGESPALPALAGMALTMVALILYSYLSRREITALNS